MVTENLQKLKTTLPVNVTLVAVSKTKPNNLIEEAYSTGQRIFGENKVQELVEKEEVLPKDIAWHMIGHLQRNKVKFIAPFVSLIHAVDSIRLLKEINKQALKCNRTINCLLQLHIAQEETKFGLSLEECSEMITSAEYKSLQNIKIVGVMGMASNVSDEAVVRSEFASIKTYFDQQKAIDSNFSILSIGMSGDYKLAIEEGSTMVRVGSAIFGSRS